jgi:hypothetical protein
MKRLEISVIGGILLIAAGVLFLLQNLEIIAGGIAPLWALLFGAGGVLFLYVYLVNRENWWAIIPGIVLLGLAALIALSTLAPAVGGAWGGALFLAALGLAFWVIYFTKRDFWWAVIPGGVLLTLALVTGLSSALKGVDTGGVFLLGLGLTFGLLSFLRTPEGRMKWALIPAAVLLVLGLALTAAGASFLKYLWAVALIAGGGYLLFRALRS